MNKITIILFVIFTTALGTAQSPIIKQFREVIKDAPNHFSAFQNELLVDNTEKRSKVYNSKVEDNAISQNFIVKTEGKTSTYIVKFDVTKIDDMMMKLFLIIAQQYITELNDMVKSGAYTGKDYREGEDNVTEIKDLNGKTVVKYVSDSKEHYVIVYAPTVQ